jgi:hypothetical protein
VTNRTPPGSEWNPCPRVRGVQRGRVGEVVRVEVAFTDWGTAVKMPEEGKRRMTLHGPGTAGYIAPDTRGPIYDYQADMWAYLVWAASMCLRVEFIVDCQLEEALAELALEKKIAPTTGHEDKVDAVLRAFEARGKVEDGCEGIFELVRTSAPWVDAALRWTPEEARDEMQVFRGDHGLVIDVSAVQQRRQSVAPRRPAPRKEEVEGGERGGLTAARTEEAEKEAGGAPVAEAAMEEAREEEEEVVEEAAAEAEMEEEEEEEAIRAARGRTAPAPMEEDAAVAETDDDEEEEEEEEEVTAVVAPPARKPCAPNSAAAAAAAAVSADWVGRRVKKWFPLSNPPKRRRGKKNAAPQKTGEYFFGFVLKTHAVGLCTSNQVDP